jgi:hypothetical protein
VSGQNAVIMDMNSFVWVSERTLLGGARYSAVATLPVAKNQLVSDIHGQLSGAVNALGLALNLVFPNQRLNLGVKFFEEFGNRAAYQGYSFQVSGAVSL